MKEYVEEREGCYYVTDSRVSLDSIVYAFRRGESPETINAQSKLVRTDIIRYRFLEQCSRGSSHCTYSLGHPKPRIRTLDKIV
jgi:hypothetical protein